MVDLVIVIAVEFPWSFDEEAAAEAAPAVAVAEEVGSAINLVHSMVVKQRLYSWIMEGYSELKSSRRMYVSYKPVMLTRSVIRVMKGCVKRVLKGCRNRDIVACYRESERVLKGRDREYSKGY